MKHKAVVVFCLLALFFGSAFSAGAQTVKTDVELVWQQNRLSLRQTLLNMNNRLYISSDGLRELGFRVEWRRVDNRYILSHADDAMAERFAPVYYRDKVIVLMYHALSDEPKEDGVLSAEDFRKQMQLLKDKRFNVISMSQYVDFVLDGSPVPDNAVLITFDDGYLNFYTHAFPVLKEFGFPATNFVIVKRIDEFSGNSKLTWDHMREMQEYGMSFFSHTYDSHAYRPVDEKGTKRPALANRLYLEEKGRKETEAEYAARVLADLTKAEARLREELGNTFGVLAFPFGAFNEQVLKLAEQAGIRVTFTIKEGINGVQNVNGFRVNAGYRGNDGREMTARMQLGLRDWAANTPELHFGDDPIGFPDAQPVVINGKLWVPLRDLMTRFQMNIWLERDAVTDANTLYIL